MGKETITRAQLAGIVVVLTGVAALSALPVDDRATLSTFMLAGPTGDAADVVGHNVLRPSNVSLGDKLVFHDVGAYGLPACSPFNGFPKPGVIVV